MKYFWMSCGNIMEREISGKENPFFWSKGGSPSIDCCHLSNTRGQFTIGEGRKRVIEAGKLPELNGGTGEDKAAAGVVLSGRLRAIALGFNIAIDIVPDGFIGESGSIGFKLKRARGVLFGGEMRAATPEKERERGDDFVRFHFCKGLRMGSYCLS